MSEELWGFERSSADGGGGNDLLSGEAAPSRVPCLQVGHPKGFKGKGSQPLVSDTLAAHLTPAQVKELANVRERMGLLAEHSKKLQPRQFFLERVRREDRYRMTWRRVGGAHVGWPAIQQLLPDYEAAYPGFTAWVIRLQREAEELTAADGELVQLAKRRRRQQIPDAGASEPAADPGLPNLRSKS